MPEIIILSSQAQFALVEFIAGSAMYGKEVLYTGKFRHPSTKKIHNFSRSDLEAMAVNTNRLIAMGVAVPFPDGHNYESRANMGFWDRFDVKDSVSAPGQHGLFARAAVPMTADQQRIGNTITAVSVCIEKEVELTDGSKVPGPVITHVCGTNYPVIPSQANFVAQFDRMAEETTTMDFITFLSAVLGKPVTQEEAVQFGKTLFASASVPTPAPASVQPVVPAAAPVAVPSATSPTVASLQEALAAERSRNAALMAIAWDDRVSAALSKGRITAPLGELFTALHKGGDVPALLAAFIDAQPDNAFFSVAPLTSSGATATLAAQKKADLEANAAVFANKGYDIKWNSDRTDFTVIKKGV